MPTEFEHDQYCNCEDCMSIVLITAFATVRRVELSDLGTSYAVSDADGDIFFTTPNQAEAESCAIDAR